MNETFAGQSNVYSDMSPETMLTAVRLSVNELQSSVEAGIPWSHEVLVDIHERFRGHGLLMNGTKRPLQLCHELGTPADTAIQSAPCLPRYFSSQMPGIATPSTLPDQQAQRNSAQPSATPLSSNAIGTRAISKLLDDSKTDDECSQSEPNISTYNRKACESTTITVYDLTAKDKSWRILFSRWGGMPQAPCSHVLKSLLETLEPDKGKYAFSNKAGPTIRPSWWPDIIPWRSPSRLEVISKKAAIAYIAMLPIWKPKVVEEKMKASNAENYGCLLEKGLKGVDLMTHYNRTTGTGRDGDNFKSDAAKSNSKEDNTSSEELGDRLLMIKELVDVAAFMDNVRTDRCDLDSVHGLHKVPQTLNRAMYGSGKGKEAEAPSRWGSGPSEWTWGGETTRFFQSSTPSVPRKRGYQEDGPDGERDDIKDETPPLEHPPQRKDAAFAIGVDHDDTMSSLTPTSSCMASSDSDDDDRTEFDEDDYQNIAPPCLADAKSAGRYSTQSTISSFDEVVPSAHASFNLCDTYPDQPLPALPTQSRPPISAEAVARWDSFQNANRAYDEEPTEGRGGHRMPEALPATQPGLVAPFMVEGNAAPVLPGSFGQAVPITSENGVQLSYAPRSFFCQTGPDTQRTGNYHPPGYWSQSFNGIREFALSGDCHCGLEVCPGCNNR